jgi:hypothetical protein
MLSVNYDACYSRFLAQVQAYDLAVIDESEARQKLNEWLSSIKSNPRVRKLFTSLTMDKNIETIFFTLKNTLKDDEADVDFVTEVFGLGVAWKWSSEKYDSLLNTAQYFGAGDRRYFSQANHITSLAAMVKDGRGNLYNFIRDHGSYNNSYIKEDT